MFSLGVSHDDPPLICQLVFEAIQACATKRVDIINEGAFITLSTVNLVLKMEKNTLGFLGSTGRIV